MRMPARRSDAGFSGPGSPSDCQGGDQVRPRSLLTSTARAGAAAERFHRRRDPRTNRAPASTWRGSRDVSATSMTAGSPFKDLHQAEAALPSRGNDMRSTTCFRSRPLRLRILGPGTIRNSKLAQHGTLSRTITDYRADRRHRHLAYGWCRTICRALSGEPWYAIADLSTMCEGPVFERIFAFCATGHEIEVRVSAAPNTNLTRASAPSRGLRTWRRAVFFVRSEIGNPVWRTQVRDVRELQSGGPEEASIHAAVPAGAVIRRGRTLRRCGVETEPMLFKRRRGMTPDAARGWCRFASPRFR